jgi:lipid-A-disaccharide synthase
MHAAHLTTALQSVRAELDLPPAIFEGNGSTRMQAAGVELLFDVARWSELGIVHNLLKAQFFHRVVTATARYILSNQHDMVILVDNRVLNLSLARMLRARGYAGRIVYYVAPVRWESLYNPAEHARSLKNRRFLDVRRFCDLALPIYPVSLEVYEELGIPYEFTGHPLCELVKPSLSDEQFSAITGIPYDPAAPPMIIGALPGSRVREVQWIAPVMYKALALMEEAFDEDSALPRLHIVSPAPHTELQDGMLDAARRGGLRNLTLISQEYNYDLMARARLMIVKSGTGLHECMLAGVPAIMCYRVPNYLAWILRNLMRFNMPYYGFPNLLAGRPVVPELIQEDCTHLKIADMAGSLLFEEAERKSMLQAFAELRELVCRPQPLKRAALRVQELLLR